MANEEHVALLKQGVEIWNKWREGRPDIRPDLSGAHLDGAQLNGMNLSRANLSKAQLVCSQLKGADLNKACLREVDLTGAELCDANLCDTDLMWADCLSADFSRANLKRAKLGMGRFRETRFLQADLRQAQLMQSEAVQAEFIRSDLSGANIANANLREANFYEAKLIGADLCMADLRETVLCRADLCGANLERTTFINTYVDSANFSKCRIFGISAWGLNGSPSNQQDLILTPEGEPPITVDDLEISQFIYILLNNRKIRCAINTITSKAVLILGRFTIERKIVLNALREELRKHDYVPILFDFDKPDSKDLTGTVQTLANMARFIIADLTEPSCIPHELAMTVPTIVVPVRPILLVGQHEYAMFIDLKRRYPWVLEPYSYDSSDRLIASLDEVIRPAETKALELRGLPPKQAGSPTA